MSQAVVGIDEVGRGSWAGPLLMSAVKLNNPINGLTDSKKLTSKSRCKLSKVIKQNSQIGFGWVSASEIDELGLSKAMFLACDRAVEGFDSSLIFVIDGSINYLKNHIHSRATVKADQKIEEVSAASIVAKVARDSYMGLMGTVYPGYKFEKNKGYGTADHLRGLSQLGSCQIHRVSFAPMRGN